VVLWKPIQCCFICNCNGTLDGYLDTGPPIVAGSTTDVTIGVYENTLRGEARQSNYYFGEIDEVVVWRYGMVESEIQEEFERVIEVYLNQTNSVDRNTITIGLHETLSLLETGGIPGIRQETLSTFLQFRDDVLVKLNETWINSSFENLGFTDQISLLFNNQTISDNEHENKTISFVENLTIQDTTQTFLPNNSTTISEGLQFTDDVLLKINDTFLLVLPENLFLTEQDTIFLNNETVEFDIQNQSSNLIHSQIEIGKPVYWTQTKWPSASTSSRITPSTSI